MITRRECAAMVVGGPTAVLDLGGLRVVSDPTFAAPHGYLTKTANAAAPRRARAARGLSARPPNECG